MTVETYVKGTVGLLVGGLLVALVFVGFFYTR